VNLLSYFANLLGMAVHNSQLERSIPLPSNGVGSNQHLRNRGLEHHLFLEIKYFRVMFSGFRILFIIKLPRGERRDIGAETFAPAERRVPDASERIYSFAPSTIER